MPAYKKEVNALRPLLYSCPEYFMKMCDESYLMTIIQDNHQGQNGTAEEITEKTPCKDRDFRYVFSPEDRKRAFTAFQKTLCCYTEIMEKPAISLFPSST